MIEGAPYWNVWYEPNSPDIAFNPLETVTTSQFLHLVLDLSAVALRSSGVANKPAGSSFLDTLAAFNQQTITLKVQVLTNSHSLIAERNLYDFPIEMERLRNAMSASNKPSSDTALGILRKDGNPEWNIGNISIGIHLAPDLANVAAKKPTLAPLTLLFWATDSSGGYVPLGSIETAICVSNLGLTCDGISAVVADLAGPQQISAALQLSESHIADAALTFVELGDSVVGVFHCGTCPQWTEGDFETWSTGWSSAQLLDQLRNPILDGLEAADGYNDERGYARAGQALFDLFFADNERARGRFTSFLQLAHERLARQRPLKLFVRVLSALPVDSFIVPTGLMATKLPTGEFEYVGRLVQIQSPLPLENYEPASTCLKQWTALLPDAANPDPEMQNAFLQLEPWISTLRQSDSATLYTDIDEFANWEADSYPVIPQGVLIILSHHEPGRLFFNATRRIPAIYSVSMLRRFAAPSIAIVDACGAAKPGAFEVLQRLNADNVTSLIGATTSVDSFMGGAYLKLLLEALKAHDQEPAYSLGDAHFDAVQKLSLQVRQTAGANGRKYGAAAFVFQIMGNPNVRLCPPNPVPRRQ